MSVTDIMKKHTIVDITDFVHVIDGEVVYYEPDSIDFDDEEQVRNLFGIVADIPINPFLQKGCGKDNTCIVIVGVKSDSRKWVSTEYLSSLPQDVLKKVRAEVAEFQKRSGRKR